MAMVLTYIQRKQLYTPRQKGIVSDWLVYVDFGVLKVICVANDDVSRITPLVWFEKKYWGYRSVTIAVAQSTRRLSPSIIWPGRRWRRRRRRRIGDERLKMNPSCHQGADIIYLWICADIVAVCLCVSRCKKRMRPSKEPGVKITLTLCRVKLSSNAEFSAGGPGGR